MKINFIGGYGQFIEETKSGKFELNTSCDWTQCFLNCDRGHSQKSQEVEFSSTVCVPLCCLCRRGTVVSSMQKDSLEFPGE